MTRLLAVFALICAASAEWRRVPVVSDAIRAQGPAFHVCYRSVIVLFVILCGFGRL